MYLSFCAATKLSRRLIQWGDRAQNSSCYNQSDREQRFDFTIATAQQLPQITPEEYLEWEPQQEIRYEYASGEVLAMTGGTIPHNDIALNLYRALYPHLRSRGCRANVSDVKVQ